MAPKAVESNPTFIQYSGTPKKGCSCLRRQENDLLKFFQKRLDNEDAWLEYVLKKNG
jgi:hypothetical protein